MPLFEYECEDCGAVQEILWRAKDQAAPLHVHLSINGRSRTLHPMLRLISAPAVIHVHGFSAINGYGQAMVHQEMRIPGHPHTRVTVSGNANVLD